jgi:3-oxoacyl-[acyl-carrier-protein] synthase II
MVSPVGLSVAESWAAALNGKSGVGPIKAFDPADINVKIAAEVKNFDPLTCMDAKEAHRSTRFVQFAVAAAKEAISDSGLNLEADTDRYGCSIGVGVGAIEFTDSTSRDLWEKGPRKVSPFFIPYTIPNMAAGIVANQFNLRGPNICTATACTSGTHGIGEAFLLIKNEMADAMVCGGAESTVCKLTVVAFANMKALSTTVEHPETASRPFDLHRNGFVLGDGAGVLVLEELEHAKRRGARIYAEVVGYGMSGDAYHITSPAPDGEGAQRCIKMALGGGKVPMNEVDYINAHGTSTKLNDLYESMAIQRVFGHEAKKIAVSSTKGVTGHCLGAAGGLEGVFSALAVYEQKVPPTANLTTPDPECTLDYVPGSAREIRVRYAMSNSFGFGGTNGSIVFKSL